MINLRDCLTLQEAWENINETLVVDAANIIKVNGASTGNQLISYGNITVVQKAWVDPNFDVGTSFGYTIKKWTGLVKNYVDFNYLDIIRKEVQMRVKSKSQSYNFSFHFSNKHGSGKDCLIALIFSAKLKQDRPVVTFMTRVSEVTCRLIFDFLLVQRCIEYVYGHNNVEVVVISPTMFITAERFSMYHNHRNIYKILKKVTNPHPFQDKCKGVLDKMLNTDPDTIKYKVHKRSALNLQKGSDGKNMSGRDSLYLKDLTFNLDDTEYPEECLTLAQRKKYKATTNK